MPAHAVTLGSTSNPAVTQTVNVQFIDVCGPTGTGCAPTGPIAQYENFATGIFTSAGVAFSFNPTIEKIKVPGNLTCGSGAVSTFCSDTNSDFDSVHDLIDTPGNGQSPVANTLNVYLVKQLIQTDNGSETFTPIYGWGLIGGNGVVIETGRDMFSGLVAAPDVMAHELGHNLGFTHTDQPPINNPSPYYLMNTATRAITTQLCVVGPYTCSGPVKTAYDQLTAAEMTTAQNSPLQNELPNVVAGLVHPCTGSGCDSSFYEKYMSVSPSETPLIGTVIRYLNPIGSPDGYIAFQECQGGGCANPIQVEGTLVGTNEQYSYTLETPLDPGGELFAYTCQVPLDGTECSEPVLDTLPFSVEFDFANGVTSRAGYDGTGYDSQFGVTYGFNPNAPGVVDGPSILPTTGVPEDVSTYGVPAPEPGALSLLVVGIGVLGLIRYRRIRR